MSAAYALVIGEFNVRVGKEGISGKTVGNILKWADRLSRRSTRFPNKKIFQL